MNREGMIWLAFAVKIIWFSEHGALPAIPDGEVTKSDGLYAMICFGLKCTAVGSPMVKIG